MTRRPASASSSPSARWVVVDAPDTFDAERFSQDGDEERRRPSFGVTLFSVLLPVFLILGKAMVDIFIDDKKNVVREVFDTLGTPLIALPIAVIVAMFALGRGAGMGRDEVTKAIESGLPSVAGIILIVAAGGGFKQVLVDSGIGTLLARWARGEGFPCWCCPGGSPSASGWRPARRRWLPSPHRRW